MASDDLSPMLSVRDAVRLARTPLTARGHGPTQVFLSTSFTPSHLSALLTGYLLRDAGHHPQIAIGPYGDLVASVTAAHESAADVIVVLVEWQDLDPRLGRREAVTAALPPSEEILRTVERRAARILKRLQTLGGEHRVVVVLPTLPLPPEATDSPSRLSPLEAALESVVAGFALRLTELASCVVTPRVRSDDAYDARADALSGHPYTQGHASRIARSVSALVAPATPKKGIITDLDDTLWRGIVGDDGVGAVHWDLASGSHAHALYQRLLAALAQRGVLIAIASKNDPDTALAALDRRDLLLPPSSYFPVVASWDRKSGSVSEILRQWNIAASDVVFVDDSPTELAEVAKRHPEITCLLFPTDDTAGVARLLHELSKLFASDSRTEEDALRLGSIRSAAELDAARVSTEDETTFLGELDGRLTVDLTHGWSQERALALVNKTNQFNLTGRRFSAQEWHALNQRDQAVHLTIEYEDTFGRLGVISVLAGTRRAQRLLVDTWVMSCRAFSRAIEHHVLEWLFDELGVDVVQLEFVPTDRNGPLRGFLEDCGVDLDSPQLTRTTLHEAAQGRLGIHRTTTTSGSDHDH